MWGLASGGGRRYSSRVGDGVLRNKKRVSRTQDRSDEKFVTGLFNIWDMGCRLIAPRRTGRRSVGGVGFFRRTSKSRLKRASKGKISVSGL